MANDTMIPAARITRLRDGKIYATHVLLQYSKPESQEAAVERVRAGKVAFVRRSDVHQVLDALGVKDDKFRE